MGKTLEYWLDLATKICLQWYDILTGLTMMDWKYSFKYFMFSIYDSFIPIFSVYFFYYISIEIAYIYISSFLVKLHNIFSLLIWINVFMKIYCKKNLGFFYVILKIKCLLHNVENLRIVSTFYHRGVMYIIVIITRVVMHTSYVQENTSNVR